MIPEELQDQAALHALGLLTADEAEQLERAMDADADLRDLVRSLREAAAEVALGAPTVVPPSALRDRVLAEIAREPAPSAAPSSPPSPPGEVKGSSDDGDGKIVPFRLPAWVPWAVAASLLFLCGSLGKERLRLRRELGELRTADPLAQVSLFALAAAGEKAPPTARAAVAWEPARQRGVLRLTGLPAPEAGKDYQLWAIGTDGRGPVSAGVVHVDAQGAAQVSFRPVAAVGQVAAFALSLEQAGGSSHNEGPILLAPGG